MIGISPAGEGVPVHGEVMAKYNGAGNTVELGRSWIELPRTRVDLTGTLGQRLDVRLLSHDLNDFSPVLDPASLPAQLASQNGSVAFNGTVTGPLSDPRIAGHADIRSAAWQAQKIDSLTGDFTAGKDGATITDAALVSSSVRAAVSGSIGLSGWKPRKTSAINATAQLTNADATALLALAGQHNVPVSGTLNVRARVAGTVGDPHATADLTLSKGRIYGEPYDSVTGHAQYLNSGAQVLTAAFTAGAKRVNASLRFDHPDKLTFNVTSNRMALNQIAFVQEREPLLKGMVQIKADGVIRADPAQPHRRVTLLDLNADLRATGLTVNSRSFGDLHLAATTKNGLLTARANSDVANAAIRGEATVQLTADYPVDAKLTFSKLQLSAVTAALETGANKAKKTNIDGSVAGELTLKGPARTPELLTASLDVSQFELHPITVTGTAKNIPDLRLRNDGPVRATLSKSIIRVESARFLAPSTSLALTGTVALRSRSPFNLQVQGNMNLALAEALNADLSSSGELAISAMVRGNFANPDVSGRAELQKGEFHLADFSNGLTNANGVVLFSGTRATIQSLTAETGGGRVNVMGFAARTNGLYAFRLEAKTHDVRVRYPEGVSSVSDSDLTLAGTSECSEVAGT
ncbi:MAG TPA: hypothetical protein VHC72_02550, partial [Bryobacteraceae bacterium]|nr:hypothetical protein [Bryobacteraceae bacterium]